MPLKLVTGPANSGKAGRLLRELRARLDEEPILVVPAFRDVERSQRELSAAGAVFGARVVRFSRLFEIVAERAAPALSGVPRASDVSRELIVEQAVRSARLTVLAASAERPGFARAALAFFGELERSRVAPERLRGALASWTDGGARRRYGEEVAELYAAYRRGLDAAGLLDDELFALRALEALSLEPFRWGRTPLLVHGFDDFTELELDAIETIAERASADVSVSLPFERGRVAFRSLAGIFERLRSMASTHEELEPSADHYLEASRAPLHHLERSLLADRPRRVEPGEAVRLLSAGGQRAEVELVASEVLALLGEGVPPGEVAVVFRDPAGSASLLEQVLDAYGVPFSLERSAPLRHTPLGRGLLALLRCALLDGSAADLVAYLRTPGRLARAGAVDRLERELRQAGAEDVERALELWAQAGRHALVEIDRLRTAARSGAGLALELDRQLERLFWGPYRDEPRTLEASERDDPRVLAAAHGALVDLHALALSDPSAVDARRLHDTLAALQVRLGEDEQPGRVLVTSPEGLRARRFEAVFVCGLQEGELPRGARPEPFLPDDDRRELATATGLRLPVREDQLDRERFLFYLCASRAERLLVLSSRVSDEEGAPSLPSFFLEDVRDVFSDTLELGTRRRSLAEVCWSAEDAPTAVEWERARAAEGPRRPPLAPGDLARAEVLAGLAARQGFSAGALEAYAGCPVRWLVERELDPVRLEPEPEAMVRGRFAHEVLELTFRRLLERTGDRRVTPSTLVQAERLALEAIAERQSDFPISPKQTRVRAAVRRLESDVLRLLRREAERDGSFAPAHLELRFGLGDSRHGPVPLAPGLSLHGVIDRVDTAGGRALVIDYKSGSQVDPVARWERRNRLQAGIYMLAVDHLLDLQAVGGVYAPLRGKDLRPRGMLAADCREEIGSGYVGTDFLSCEKFDEQLRLVRERVAAVVEELRSGRIECRPQSCSSRGGCAHPSICRQD